MAQIKKKNKQRFANSNLFAINTSSRDIGWVLHEWRGVEYRDPDILSRSVWPRTGHAVLRKTGTAGGNTMHNTNLPAIPLAIKPDLSNELFHLATDNNVVYYAFAKLCLNWSRAFICIRRSCLDSSCHALY